MTPQIITKLHLQFIENLSEYMNDFPDVEIMLVQSRVQPLLMVVGYEVKFENRSLTGGFEITEENYHTITAQHKTRVYQFLKNELWTTTTNL